MKKFWFYSYKV